MLLTKTDPFHVRPTVVKAVNTIKHRTLHFQS